MREHFKVVCIPCEALYKCSAIPFFCVFYQALDSERPQPPPRRKKQRPTQVRGPAASVRRGCDEDDVDDEDDDFKPVSVDMNAVKNLLHSYEAQQGLAGPTSNILGAMGVRLPPPSPPDDF